VNSLLTVSEVAECCDALLPASRSTVRRLGTGS
jgi:hypothetical protein